MTRLKKVFTTSQEVAHKWASRSQEEGRSSNCFFHKDIIYSYGYHFPLGRFVDLKSGTVVLLNSRSYSATTSKHQREVSMALQSSAEMERFHVPMDRYNEGLEHERNIHAYVYNFNANYKAALKSNSKVVDFVDAMGAEAGEMNRYIKTFKVKGIKEILAYLKANSSDDLPKLFKQMRKFRIETLPQPLQNKLVKYRNARFERAERKRLAEEAAQAETMLYLPLWLSGQDTYRVDDVTKNINVWRLPLTYLRIEGNEVVTSKGARVPVVRAQKLWNVMKVRISIRELNGVNLIPMTRFNDTNRVGSYEFNSFDGQTLIVGCHHIEMEEINRFTKQEGW